MARLAGSGTHYKIRAHVTMLDAEGNPTDNSWEVDHELPSVTSILDAVIAKPNLYGWYYGKGIEGVEQLFAKYGDKVPRDADSLKSLLRTEKLSPFSRRDSAADSGRVVHAQLEKLVAGETVQRDDSTAGILDWWETKGLTPEHVEACEIPLANLARGYAGTVDLVYLDPVSGVRVLCDLKTGNGVYWTHFLQGEAYRLAWDAIQPTRPVHRVSVLHAPARGVLKSRTYREVTSPEVTAGDFLNVLSIYNSMPKKVVLEDVA